jgi:putative ABC transport system permease protein
MIASLINEKNGIKPGDTVTVKFILDGIKKKEMTVSGIAKQYAGSSCFMDIDTLGKILGQGKFATGVLIKVDKGMEKAVEKELFKISGIKTVENRMDGLNGFKEFMNFMYGFIGFMIFFGIAMGFAIIFNSTSINIMERRRELASLKVLGYSRWEIEALIFRENMFIGMFSLLPGMILGKFFCNIFAKQFSTDMFTFDVIIYPATYIIIFASVLFFIVLAQLTNRKSISGLNMVEVLQNREG